MLVGRDLELLSAGVIPMVNAWTKYWTCPAHDATEESHIDDHVTGQLLRRRR